jgi:hypothetical protein
MHFPNLYKPGVLFYSFSSICCQKALLSCCSSYFGECLNIWTPFEYGKVNEKIAHMSNDHAICAYRDGGSSLTLLLYFCGCFPSHPHVNACCPTRQSALLGVRTHAENARYGSFTLNSTCWWTRILDYSTRCNFTFRLLYLQRKLTIEVLKRMLLSHTYV